MSSPGLRHLPHTGPPPARRVEYLSRRNGFAFNSVAANQQNSSVRQGDGSVAVSRLDKVASVRPDSSCGIVEFCRPHASVTLTHATSNQDAPIGKQAGGMPPARRPHWRSRSPSSAERVGYLDARKRADAVPSANHQETPIG